MVAWSWLGVRLHVQANGVSVRRWLGNNGNSSGPCGTVVAIHGELLVVAEPGGVARSAAATSAAWIHARKKNIIT